jgi:16S rRNA (guanine1207-N2)-methyltransferase
MKPVTSEATAHFPALDASRPVAPHDGEGGTPEEIVYGSPPPALAISSLGALQVSPLIPGAALINDIADGGIDRAVILAPPGTVERRYVLAQTLRAMTPGGELIALAPKDKGGMRLRDELEAFGCTPIESARRHHRIVACAKPEIPSGLAEAIAAGGPQIAPRLGLWSQPGVFSWDRLDPGTGLLLEALPPLAGDGADFGCGVGVLARAVLGSPNVSSLLLIDVDARAVAAARRNIDDARAVFEHRDVRARAPADLDFVVMNPPFHDAGHEDRSLGQAFIAAAAVALKPGGVCWMVANVALPYEAVLSACFARVTQVAQTRGYKVYEARK